MKYQVTIYNAENKYRPISTIVDVAESTLKADIIAKGITKIAQKRYWTKADFAKYGYTKVKFREYEEKR